MRPDGPARRASRPWPVLLLVWAVAGVPTAHARRMLLNGLDTLDHIGVLGTVLIPHWFDRVLERFLVGDFGDGDSGSARLVHCFLFILDPEHTLFELHFAAEFDQQCLIFFRERVPCPP